MQSVPLVVDIASARSRSSTSRFPAFHDAPKASLVLAIIALTLAVGSLLVEAMSPIMLTQGHDPCFPDDAEDALICHPTRCFHLFNITGNGTDPEPVDGYPQTYVRFQCVVETYTEYPDYSARVCKKPMCYCNSGYQAFSSTGCSPGKLADCWNQSCVAE